LTSQKILDLSLFYHCFIEIDDKLLYIHNEDQT